MKLKPSILASSALVLAVGGAIATAAIAQDSGAQLAGARYSADTLSVENFIGRIEIRTGSGSEIRVETRNTGGLADDPQITNSGSGVMIDGGQNMRGINCNSRNGQMRIGRRWQTAHPITDYPQLIITAPADVAFELERSAVQGEAGDIGSLDFSMSSCGDFEIGDVAEDAHIRIAGSGDIVAGEIGGQVQVDIAGSGDVELGGIGSHADVQISGSGDVRMRDVDGDASVSINGSGDVDFDDVRGLAVRVSGSGDVSAASMNGPFEASIGGSGDISVGGGRAEPFEASIMGSGDISFRGTAVNVMVREMGGGDVEIRDIEGSISWQRNGRTVLRTGEAD